jgi:hypothetical protein
MLVSLGHFVVAHGYAQEESSVSVNHGVSIELGVGTVP